ncbi:MAG: hypothetical protein KC535_04235 [Nanoarchaeota archaeon]|nr:hypothetical protein [Nanoarchaeota archaeon]
MKKLFLLMMLLAVAVPTVSAYLSLDTIYTDPAIISSGDEVDVVVQYENKLVDAEELYNNNFDYTFKVSLETDDDVTDQYIRILDSQGDDYGSAVYSGNKYNKIFRIKVSDNAPAGTYQFRLVGEWYLDGEATGDYRDETFEVEVKREAINIDIASIESNPATVRPGDVGVELHTYIQNVGVKEAKSVTVTLDMPEGFSPSYIDNNRKWIGGLTGGETKETAFYFDLSPDLEGGVYPVIYTLVYEDLDDNVYTTSGTLPVFVKEKANIEVTQEEIIGKRGGSTILELTVKNVGLAAAEHIDVRVLKQSSQPFTFGSRSQYVGLLAPGESTTVQFLVDVDRSASEEVHNFDVIVRAKGDSDQGDTAIYTYNRKAQLLVQGTAISPLLFVGAALVIIIVIAWSSKKKGGKKR